LPGFSSETAYNTVSANLLNLQANAQTVDALAPSILSAAAAYYDLPPHRTDKARKPIHTIVISNLAQASV